MKPSTFYVFLAASGAVALLAAIILAPCALPLNGPPGYCYPLIIKGDKLR